MKKKKMSKIFMWMFFIPVGLWTFYGLITSIIIEYLKRKLKK